MNEQERQDYYGTTGMRTLATPHGMSAGEMYVWREITRRVPGVSILDIKFSDGYINVHAKWGDTIEEQAILHSKNVDLLIEELTERMGVQDRGNPGWVR